MYVFNLDYIYKTKLSSKWPPCPLVCRVYIKGTQKQAPLVSTVHLHFCRSMAFQNLFFILPQQLINICSQPPQKLQQSSIDS